MFQFVFAALVLALVLAVALVIHFAGEVNRATKALQVVYRSTNPKTWHEHHSLRGVLDAIRLSCGLVLSELTGMYIPPVVPKVTDRQRAEDCAGVWVVRWYGLPGTTQFEVTLAANGDVWHCRESTGFSPWEAADRAVRAFQAGYCGIAVREMTPPGVVPGDHRDH